MKKHLRKSIFLVLMMLPVVTNGQILISLIFGESLNSDKIEFGIVGGLNRSYINSISEAEGLNNFDMGFYFHVLVKNSTYLSTGLLVKSNVGATGLDVYPTGDPSFDDVFQDGILTKRINCFSVPILFHQRFNNRWYIEAGPQLALIYKPKDIFKVSDSGEDITYSRDTSDEYKRIDAGLLAGAGYKFKKEIKSMSAGINYYYGLVDVSADPDLKIKNSAIYFYIKIPIGAGKSSE